MKITLRKPKISDAKTFREVFNDEEVVKQLVGYKYPLTLEHAKKQLDKIINKNKKDNYYEFAIIEDNKWAGMIVLEKPSKDKKTFTLGYALGRKYWNKGITTQAIKQICDFGFNKLKLNKIIADNDEDNPASGRVLEKNGFKFIRKEKKRNTNVIFWEKENTLISRILDYGKITSLTHSTGIGSTGEAHLAKYNSKKYLLRICKDKETAERYIKYYNQFKKYRFFPKLLETQDNYLLFEFIKGRTCKEETEDTKVIEQIGKICAIINKGKASYDYKSGFFRKLNAISEKKILTKSKISEIREFYRKSKVNLKISLDAGDVTNDNFMMAGKKVYFVDIEAIKPNITGFGIAKSFSSWFKNEKERKAFERGYSKVNSMKFFNKDYQDLCTLIFLIHRINFKHDKGEHNLVEISIKKLDRILLESKVSVEIIKSKDLNKKDKKALEELRVKEFGEENRKDFKKDYESETLWVIIKKKEKIVSFGGIRPIKVKFNSKVYNIGGICSTISVIKKKGYGKIMVNVMKDYSEKTGKTILGFTGQTKFFAKCGFGTKKNFIRRFVWIKPNGEKVYDPDGDGIYYEGKDKLISKMLKSKSPAYIFVEFW